MLHCDMLHYDNYLHCKYMSHRVPYLDKGIGSTELTPGKSNSIHEAAKQQQTAVNKKLNTKKRFSHHRRSTFKKRSLFNSTQIVTSFRGFLLITTPQSIRMKHVRTRSFVEKRAPTDDVTLDRTCELTCATRTAHGSWYGRWDRWI